MSEEDKKVTEKKAPAKKKALAKKKAPAKKAPKKVSKPKAEDKAAVVAGMADADQLYTLEEAAEIIELKRRGFNPNKAVQIVEEKRNK